MPARLQKPVWCGLLSVGLSPLGRFLTVAAPLQESPAQGTWPCWPGQAGGDGHRAENNDDEINAKGKSNFSCL